MVGLLHSPCSGRAAGWFVGAAIGVLFLPQAAGGDAELLSVFRYGAACYGVAHLLEFCRQFQVAERFALSFFALGALAVVGRVIVAELVVDEFL